MFSEQDVDRELKAALTVSPSPDFAARVLQRIQVDRGLKTPVVRGAGLYLAVAASMVLAAGLFYALNRTPVVVAPPATPPGIARTEPRPAPAQPLTPTAAKPIERRQAARVRPTAAARRAEPEVILPMNQMEAVRRLVRAVNEGRIAAPTERVEARVGLPKEVVVAPLVIDPIPVPAVEPDADAPFPINRGH